MDVVADNPTAVSADEDVLWQQLKTIPAFRALLRSVEARFYQVVDLPHPILDVGCGDGHFAEVTFDERLETGIDPWWGPLQKARKRDIYDLPLQALGDNLPFPDHAFASAFSNSVLEHIPDIQPVLNETSRVLQPGAPFVITVPSHFFGQYLGGADFLNRLGLGGLGQTYRDFFNRISRHAHTDAPEVWAERLALAGFTVERWQYYFSRDALRALELGHAQGVPSAVLHALTGHWIIGPWESNLRRTEQWVRPYYEEPFPEEGAYLFFLARKTADGPVEAPLPPPRPYTPAELEAGKAAQTPEVDTGLAPEPQAQDELTAAAAPVVEREEDETASSLRFVLPGFLVALTLLLAALGQSSWRAAPEEPATGLSYFLLSALSFLALLWIVNRSQDSAQRHWRLPSQAAVPRRRWLALPALLLSLIAYRFAATPDYLNPIVPLLIWAAAIALGWYALYQEPLASLEAGLSSKREDRIFTIKASILLFLVALILRVYDLAQHPFILNGTEASMGLEAQAVLTGLLNNPFSSGWLTNPTLPYFLQALPLRILGSSAEALRLPTAVIGALTVPVLFVLGQRLYGRITGLVAAVLLLGSHAHIHFSRSGLTNAWDALLTVLALGLIAIAWQKRPRAARQTWLLAGLAVGLSAYLYTVSHLLPIMLLVLAFILVLLDRSTVHEQWRNVLALGILAFIVALPQLRHYQDVPGAFMERAQVLGILDSQSGWLSNEAAVTGESQFTLLGEQVANAALAFNGTVDTGTSYGPGVPLLNFVFGMLAVLGFILALFRLRKIAYSTLVVCVAVTILFGGALLVGPPNSHRYIIALPAVSLLAALALNELLSVFIRQDDASYRGSRRTWALIAVVIAAGIAALDIGFYFGRYRQEHQFADRNTEIADRMAHYLNDLPGEWTAHFYGPPAMYVDFPNIPFLAGDFHEGINLFNVPADGSPVAGGSANNQVYLFLPQRYAEIETLRAALPDGIERTISGYYADPLFYVYEVRGSP